MRNLNTLHIRLQYSEVLSGVFDVDSDARSLLALVKEAYVHGEQRIVNDMSPPLLQFYHRSAWATHVQTIIDCDFGEHEGAPNRLEGIGLIDAENNQLYIADTTVAGRPHVYIGTPDERDTDLSLADSTEIIVGRLAVTIAAQKFFEAAP